MSASGLPIHAGVAELEALVDEREVGKEVARRGVRDRRPVGVRPGAEADAADSIAVPLDDARRRAARALDPADADEATLAPSERPPRDGRGRRAGGRGCRGTGAARARAARVGPARRRRAAERRRLEVVVCEARARRPHVLGDARCARGGADDSERRSPTAPSTMPMSGIRSMNDPLKSSAFQARDDSTRMRVRVSRASRTADSVEVEGAAADRDGAEQEAVAGQALVQAPGVVDERGEAARAGRDADAGADRADVVERVPDALELEQDRPGPRELARGLEAERLLARVRVRDGVASPSTRRRSVRRPGVRLPNGAPRPPARGHGACRRVARRRGGSGRRRRGIGSGPTRSPLHGSGRRRPGTDRAPCTGVANRSSVDVVIDERPQRLVPVEADAVEVVRLALVPAGGRGEVDDRRHRVVLGGNALDPELVRPARPGASAPFGSPPAVVAWRLAKRHPSASAAATASR